MGIVNPPDPPYVSGNAIADVQRAYEWTAAFFTQRAPVQRLIGQVIQASFRQLG